MSTFKTFKLDIPQDVVDFVNEISERSIGYQVFIGGGYLRDLYFNSIKTKYEDYKLEPKDLDLFVVPDTTISEDVRPSLWIPAKGYTNFVKESWEIPDMQERGVAKVTGMWFKSLTTADVQLIEYKNSMTSSQLAQDMDMNINQIMYRPFKGDCICTNAFIEGHENEVIEAMHDYDRVRMYKRYVRMQDKFFYYNVEGKPELERDEVVKLATIVDHEGSFCDSDDLEEACLDGGDF